MTRLTRSQTAALARTPVPETEPAPVAAVPKPSKVPRASSTAPTKGGGVKPRDAKPAQAGVIKRLAGGPSDRARKARTEALNASVVGYAGLATPQAKTPAQVPPPPVKKAPASTRGAAREGTGAYVRALQANMHESDDELERATADSLLTYQQEVAAIRQDADLEKALSASREEMAQALARDRADAIESADLRAAIERSEEEARQRERRRLERVGELAANIKHHRGVGMPARGALSAQAYGVALLQFEGDAMRIVRALGELPTDDRKYLEDLYANDIEDIHVHLDAARKALGKLPAGSLSESEMESEERPASMPPRASPPRVVAVIRDRKLSPEEAAFKKERRREARLRKAARDKAVRLAKRAQEEKGELFLDQAIKANALHRSRVEKSDPVQLGKRKPRSASPSPSVEVVSVDATSSSDSGARMSDDGWSSSTLDSDTSSSDSSTDYDSAAPGPSDRHLHRAARKRLKRASRKALKKERRAEEKKSSNQHDVSRLLLAKLSKAERSVAMNLPMVRKGVHAALERKVLGRMTDFESRRVRTNYARGKASAKLQDQYFE